MAGECETAAPLDVREDPAVTWYGPHTCDQCGAPIVRAALEAGGAAFNVPQRLLTIYRRGSENGDPALCYPMTWAPHVCVPAAVDAYQAFQRQPSPVLHHPV